MYGDPFDIDFIEGELVCFTNNLIALLFTIFTFSTSCSIIVANQLNNLKNKKTFLKKSNKQDNDESEL